MTLKQPPTPPQIQPFLALFSWSLLVSSSSDEQSFARVHRLAFLLPSPLSQITKLTQYPLGSFPPPPPLQSSQYSPTIRRPPPPP